MLDRNTLDEAINEAERFLKRAKHPEALSDYSRHNGAIRRSAYDLVSACVAINRVSES